MLTALIHNDGVDNNAIRAAEMGIEYVARQIHRDGAVVNVAQLNRLHQYQEAFHYDRFDLEQFDPTVDVHLILTSREIRRKNKVKNGVIGIGSLLAGYGVVSADKSEYWTREVVAHETAHSLGFVATGAKNSTVSNGEPSNHCSCSACIMYPTIGKSLKKEFCEDCCKEMELLGTLNLAYLRSAREKHSKITRGKDIIEYNNLVKSYSEKRVA